MKPMKVHPVAKQFPILPAKEMKELREDIAKNGIRVPILVNKERDTILDGRNRWMIAHELKLHDGEVPMEVFKGKEEDIPSVIISRNIMRRHLTDDQRVMLITKIRGPGIEADAKRRERAGVADPSLKSGKGGSFKGAAGQLAAEAKTSRYKAEQALNVRKHAAEIVADVVAGKVPLREGAKAARKRRPASQRKARPKKVKTLEEIVRDKFSRFMEAFPYQKRAEVRAILRKLI